MASIRDIRRRIKSTQNTQQIMHAMQLVSGSKFKRAQGQLLQGRDVLSFLDGLLERVLGATEGVDHPLCVSRGGPSVLMIVTSDTGLCGSYNANLISLAEGILSGDDRPDQLVFLGKKGYNAFTKRGFEAADAILNLAGRPDVERIDSIGDALLKKFLSGEVGSVKILSSKFISAAHSKAQVVRWLPAAISPTQDEPGATEGLQAVREYIFEPSSERVFEDLLPRWALAKFQICILEAFTAEHSARMIAMKNATDNAKELIGELTHLRNQIRQTAITREISEIVGTAEALK